MLERRHCEVTLLASFCFNDWDLSSEARRLLLKLALPGEPRCGESLSRAATLSFDCEQSTNLVS